MSVSKLVFLTLPIYIWPPTSVWTQPWQAPSWAHIGSSCLLADSSELQSVDISQAKQCSSLLQPLLRYSSSVPYFSHNLWSICRCSDPTYLLVSRLCLSIFYYSFFAVFAPLSCGEQSLTLQSKDLANTPLPHQAYSWWWSAEVAYYHSFRDSLPTISASSTATTLSSLASSIC